MSKKRSKDLTKVLNNLLYHRYMCRSEEQRVGKGGFGAVSLLGWVFSCNK